MTDPFEPDDGAAFKVSIKGGKGYDEPWLTITGRTAAELKQRVIDAFQIEDAEGLSLAEVVNNATQDFATMRTASSRMDARAIPSSSSETQPNDDVWTDAERAAQQPKEPPDPNKALLDEIEAATTTLQLQKFWVEHNPLNDVVKAAWSAKGKSLKAQEEK